MREIKLTVYFANELKQKAPAGFDRAFNNWCSCDFPWRSNLQEILDKLQSIFPVKVTDWDIDRNFISFSMTCEDEVEELSGVRLQKYIWNNYFNDLFKGKYFSTYKSTGLNFKSKRSKVMFTTDCPLTGVCYDNDVIEPIYSFLKDGKQALFGHSINFKDLMRAVLESWVKTYSEAVESYYTEEVFLEEADSNEWEFFADGSMI